MRPELNDTGVLLLKTAIESLKIRRCALKFESQGVLEIFSIRDGDDKM